MDLKNSPLWDLFEKQKKKGLAADMRQTLAKIEKASGTDSRWNNAMGEICSLEKNHALAARFFRQAFRQEDKPEYRLNHANALYFAGEISNASQALRDYLALHPDDYHARLNLANCLLGQGRLQEARAICLEMKQGGMARCHFLNLLGQTHFLERSWEQALSCFTEALRVAPDYTEALFNCANTHFERGSFAEAVELYSQCLRRDENLEPAWLHMAIIHLQERNLPEARTCLGKAERHLSKSPEFHFLRGRLHVEEKEFRLARESFKQALDRQPNHVGALLGLSRLALIQAEKEEAWAWIRRVLGRPALAAGERWILANLLYELEEFPSALDQLGQLEAVDGKGEQNLLSVQCLWRLGRTEEALQGLENQLKEEGEKASLLTVLGLCLFEKGAADLAEKRWRRALELEPEALAPALRLAALEAERHNPEEACRLLERVLPAHPYQPDLLYNLACSWAGRRNREKAMRYLVQALRCGFQDWEKIRGDADLGYLRQFEEFDLALTETGLM